MIKAKLFLLSMAYLFILQPVRIGLLWQDYRLYYLAVINALFFIVLIILTKQNRETVSGVSASPLRKSHPRTQLVSEEDEGQLSASNIEKIKIKINKTKQQPLAKGSGLYRLLAFLAAVFGL